MIAFVAENAPAEAIKRQAERLFTESGLGDEGLFDFWFFRTHLDNMAYKLAGMNSELTVAEARARVFTAALDALSSGTVESVDELYRLIAVLAETPRLSAPFQGAIKGNEIAIRNLGDSAALAEVKLRRAISALELMYSLDPESEQAQSQLERNVQALESRPFVTQRRKEWIEQGRVFEGIPPKVEKATGAIEEYKTEVEKTAEAMASLNAETGSLFERMRKLDEFKPENLFYEQLIKQGASAAQLRDALIETGLESEERANEIFQRAQWASFADLIAESIAKRGGSVAEGWALAQQGLEDPDIAGKFSGATVVNGDNVYSINFYGDVIDIEMIRNMIDEAINATRVESGITS